MSIGEIFYIVALVLFIGITFVIIRNYYRNKFDPDGNRIDMIDEDKHSS